MLDKCLTNIFFIFHELSKYVFRFFLRHSPGVPFQLFPKKEHVGRVKQKIKFSDFWTNFLIIFYGM